MIYKIYQWPRSGSLILAKISASRCTSLLISKSSLQLLCIGALLLMSFRKPWEVCKPLMNTIVTMSLIFLLSLCLCVCFRHSQKVRSEPSLIPLALSQVISHLARHVMLSNGVVKRRNALWVLLRISSFVPRSLTDLPEGRIFYLFETFARVCTVSMWIQLRLRFNLDAFLVWIWDQNCPEKN